MRHGTSNWVDCHLNTNLISDWKQSWPRARTEGVFCSTSVPLAITWRGQLTFSSLCPLYSKQRSQLIPESTINSREKSWECQDSNPGVLGEKQEFYPCSLQSPTRTKSLWLIFKRKINLFFFFSETATLVPVQVRHRHFSSENDVATMKEEPVRKFRMVRKSCHRNVPESSGSGKKHESLVLIDNSKKIVNQRSKSMSALSHCK